MIHIVMDYNGPIKAFYSEKTARKMIEDLKCRGELQLRNELLNAGHPIEYIERYIREYFRPPEYIESVEIS